MVRIVCRASRKTSDRKAGLLRRIRRTVARKPSAQANWTRNRPPRPTGRPTGRGPTPSGRRPRRPVPSRTGGRLRHHPRRLPLLLRHLCFAPSMSSRQSSAASRSYFRLYCDFIGFSIRKGNELKILQCTVIVAPSARALERVAILILKKSLSED